MIDMHIAPKSDQLNADDLIAGPLTVQIVAVKASGAEQPIAIHLANGVKPYLPCKSMRRLMVAIWGLDASQYTGRRLTLYRDATVAFGGLQVGGIRISHASHLDREVVIALTVTRGKRAPFRVLPLHADSEESTAADLLTRVSEAYAAASALLDERKRGERTDDHDDQLTDLANLTAREGTTHPWRAEYAAARKARRVTDDQQREISAVLSAIAKLVTEMETP